MDNWISELNQHLLKQFGKNLSSTLCKKYQSAFPASYIDTYPPLMAVADIAFIEKLTSTQPLVTNFYCDSENKQCHLHLRVYQLNKPLSLSDILPILENLDLRIETESLFELKLPNHQHAWLTDFSIIDDESNKNAIDLKDLFQDALNQIYHGIAENDGFNKLVLCAGLSAREIIILRTYAKYLHQIGFHFTQAYIETALIKNAELTQLLVSYFIKRFDPSLSATQRQSAVNIEKDILERLNKVSSLDEDKIIRKILELIKVTLRTNYFQLNKNNKVKDYLSIKLNSREITNIPLPAPLYEIFVYSPRFEGIHLRNTKVARGGIRWSTRREDFRTEVLGLMKAQVVKNAVIVPSGAKGGFVLKAKLTDPAIETLQNEVVACYKSFIHGLLDLTDNIVNNKIIEPSHVISYDEHDPYLVVAADKGTATFSDIANQISQEIGFWLGDAFASGGKTGYDHKKIGITARGAWESIKRHFRELNMDVLETDISVIGIGDMSGDVFGNGMLYSKHIKLIAAFDHRDIFLDPTPDPETSYRERSRLFKLARSSWQDYDAKCISKGGGVFSRSLKTIKLSAQIKKALDISENELAPNDLIRAILKAPVDLLFNGGIGTYVKASSEIDLEVGDRSNDFCRINGNELRCKVVGEGGNLGFTQLGRIEFALKGGIINTDFIDNSAGVDCSDHEVNLKILLDKLIKNGKLAANKRNGLLAKATDEVAKLVLLDNRDQALALSLMNYNSNYHFTLITKYLQELESLGIINRTIEFLPTEKELLERQATGASFTRPELAILLAYTKIHIKQAILQSKLPDDEYLSRRITYAFPESTQKIADLNSMKQHRLYRDIIATLYANYIINDMGLIFIYRLQIEMGASVEDIIRAYIVATEVFATDELKRLIMSFNFKIKAFERYEMFNHVNHLINLATRWFLRTKSLQQNLEPMIKHYGERVKKLTEVVPALMTGVTKQYLDELAGRFQNAGLTKEVAHRVGAYRAIYTTLNIIEVATSYNFDLMKTAQIYFLAGEKANLVWLRDQISNDSREGYWNSLARLTLRDELDIAQRALTVAIMKHDKKGLAVKKMVETWAEKNQRLSVRWEKLLSMLMSAANLDYTMFFIALRELLGLITVAE